MAHMDANEAGSARAKAEFELARVQNALAVSEEARRKADDEASCLAFERVSLLLEIGTTKDEVFALLAQALKEKKALKEAYKEGFEVIFNYGYGCCAFAHNIYGSQPVVQTGCQTRLSHYPQSSLSTLDAPWVLSLPKPRPSMFA